MLLLELFPEAAGPDDDDQAVSDHGEMTERLRQAALDVITPMLGINVPFVTIQQVIDRLSGARFGIVITPALIMQILDPQAVKAVNRIEGDRIYLTQAKDTAEREVDDGQQQKDQEHVGDMAVDQINKNLKQ